MAPKDRARRCPAIRCETSGAGACLNGVQMVVSVRGSYERERERERASERASAHARQRASERARLQSPQDGPMACASREQHGERVAAGSRDLGGVDVDARMLDYGALRTKRTE